MGILSSLVDKKSSAKKSPIFISSPYEANKARDDPSQEGAIAGAKAAAVTSVVTTVPTLLACRVIPWAKANLNYTAQALIISGASVAAYFVVADKTILDRARRNSFQDRD